MLSREIRQKIIKTIQTITIKSLNDDLKENINNNLEFADICVDNYAQMYSISYRVNKFFYDALLELKLDVKINNNKIIKKEIIQFYELDVAFLF